MNLYTMNDYKISSNHSSDLTSFVYHANMITILDICIHHHLLLFEIKNLIN